jgi:hypothetical protein
MVLGSAKTAKGSPPMTPTRPQKLRQNGIALNRSSGFNWNAEQRRAALSGHQGNAP